MRVAVVGLGRMGRAVAERLLAAGGHELTVYNRSPAAAVPFATAGACVAQRPVDVWQTADVALTLVADPDAVLHLTLGHGGLLSGRAGGALVEMSTIDVATSARVAGRAQDAGVGYARAPISGNPEAVAAGTASVVVSGDAELTARLRPLLVEIGPAAVTWVGDGEQARVVKLCLNLVLAGTAQLLAEALVLGESHGVAPRGLLEVLGASAVGSAFVRYKTDALVADDLRSTFTTTLMLKDMGLIRAAAAATGVPLPLTEETAALLEECVASGYADADFMALVPRLRAAAGRT